MQTKHGVRDLNGPNLNGRGYNGRRSATCPHFRSPDSPTYHVDEPRMVTVCDTAGNKIGERTKMVRAYHCSYCGEKRWDGMDEV